MKNLFMIFNLIIYLFLFPISSQTMEFYLYGLNVKNLKNMSIKKVLTGAAFSYIAHAAGHLLYLEILGKDWKLEIENLNLREYPLEPLSDQQGRWFGRSGFVFQNLIGFALTNFERTKTSDFTKGFTAYNLIEVTSYPIRYQNEGDFFLIDYYNGNSALEWPLYSGIAFYNFSKSFQFH